MEDLSEIPKTDGAGLPCKGPPADTGKAARDTRTSRRDPSGDVTSEEPGRAPEGVVLVATSTHPSFEQLSPKQAGQLLLGLLGNAGLEHEGDPNTPAHVPTALWKARIFSEPTDRLLYIAAHS